MSNTVLPDGTNKSKATHSKAALNTKTMNSLSEAKIYGEYSL
jgi:hypothetical protein